MQGSARQVQAEPAPEPQADAQVVAFKPPPPRTVTGPAVAVSVSPASRGPEPKPSDSDLPKLLAIFNHKGGTGKTTTSVSIAAGLAAMGKRVLLVDTDSQGNVAISLNVSADRSLYHVLVMGLPVKAVSQTVRENLDLVASNETLAAAELYLAGKQNRDRVLRDRLMGAVQGYDYVLLDCSPSLSLMNQNALVFADSVLVPVACDFLSLAGVRQVLKTVRNVNSLLHHPVRIWGVLPTFYDARANICRNAVETLQQHFGERCLPPIRQAIKVKEAPSEGRTIFEYAPGSAPAEDYRTVVDRIVHGHQAQSFNTQAEAATAC
jgi:chromosome partitioning protein